MGGFYCLNFQKLCYTSPLKPGSLSLTKHSFQIREVLQFVDGIFHDLKDVSHQRKLKSVIVCVKVLGSAENIKINEWQIIFVAYFSG